MHSFNFDLIPARLRSKRVAISLVLAPFLLFTIGSIILDLITLATVEVVDFFSYYFILRGLFWVSAYYITFILLKGRLQRPLKRYISPNFSRLAILISTLLTTHFFVHILYILAIRGYIVLLERLTERLMAEVEKCYLEKELLDSAISAATKPSVSAIVPAATASIIKKAESIISSASTSSIMETAESVISSAPKGIKKAASSIVQAATKLVADSIMTSSTSSSVVGTVTAAVTSVLSSAKAEL